MSMAAETQVAAEHLEGFWVGFAQANRREGACVCDCEQPRVSRRACLVEVAIIVTLAARARRAVQVQAPRTPHVLHYDMQPRNTAGFRFDSAHAPTQAPAASLRRHSRDLIARRRRRAWALRTRTRMLHRQVVNPAGRPLWIRSNTACWRVYPRSISILTPYKPNAELIDPRVCVS
jgi:hypothetical protein